LTSFEEAQLYPQLFTDEFISYLAYDALTSNLTLTVGDKIPNILIDSKKITKKAPKSKRQVSDKSEDTQ
jgi:hypothetical protein